MAERIRDAGDLFSGGRFLSFECPGFLSQFACAGIFLAKVSAQFHPLLFEQCNLFVYVGRWWRSGALGSRSQIAGNFMTRECTVLENGHPYLHIGGLARVSDVAVMSEVPVQLDISSHTAVDNQE